MEREPARIYIERMKDALKVRTDEELARSLGYSKQAVANWRRRNTIPFSVSSKMADAFGPSFAATGAHRSLVEIRDSEVVHAVALFAYEQYLADIGRIPTTRERQGFGYLFPQLVRALQREMTSTGFEGENSRSMIETLILMVERRAIPEVEAILKKAPREDA